MNVEENLRNSISGIRHSIFKKPPDSFTVKGRLPVFPTLRPALCVLRLPHSPANFIMVDQYMAHVSGRLLDSGNFTVGAIHSLIQGAV